MAVPGWKVKDGLFVGNEVASRDEPAITDSKVTHVINCCGRQVSNVFGHLGVKYLTYNWVDGPKQVILDPTDQVISDAYAFIEEALEQGDGVLVHSFLGSSRSVCLVMAYMMKKYRWSLKKATAFLESRQLEMQMKPNFLQQLSAFELRLASKSEVPLSMDWEVGGSGALDGEQLLLRNTFLNATAETPIDLRPTPPRTHKLKWSDDMAGDKSRLEQTLSPTASPRASPSSSPRATPSSGSRKPALKGSRAAAAAAAAADAEVVGASDGVATGMMTVEGGSITIRTKAGVVKCNPEEIVHKRFGLKFSCSTIILEYSVPTRNLRAHHAVKVDLRSLAAGSLACDAAAAEHLKEAHAPWLSGVSAAQLAELVGRLRSAAGGC